MTVAVGVAAPDGLVVASDSRTTKFDGVHYRVMSDAAPKVFTLFDRFALTTYGLAYIGEVAVAALVSEFEATTSLSSDEDTRGFCGRVSHFFEEKLKRSHPRLQKRKGYPLGFIVGGYDRDGVGRLLETGAPGGVAVLRADTAAMNGFVFLGQRDVGLRILDGVDHERLDKSGVELSQSVSDALGSLRYMPLLPSSLQDAVELAALIVRTTIGVQRFTDGTVGEPNAIPGAGGSLQLLTVTPSELRWLSRPEVALVDDEI